MQFAYFAAEEQPNGKHDIAVNPQMISALVERGREHTEVWMQRANDPWVLELPLFEVVDRVNAALVDMGEQEDDE